MIWSGEKHVLFAALQLQFMTVGILDEIIQAPGMGLLAPAQPAMRESPRADSLLHFSPPEGGFQALLSLSMEPILLNAQLPDFDLSKRLTIQ